MTINTNAMKEPLAIAYGATALYGALYTTTPGGSAGTEVTGGSPAYARKALTWTAGATDGVVTVTATFDIPAGTTVVGLGVHSAVTAGTYYDGAAVTSQTWSAQGTADVTFTYTQS